MHRNVAVIVNGDDRVERRFAPARWPFPKSRIVSSSNRRRAQIFHQVDRQHLTDVIRSPWNVLVVAQEPGLLDVLIHTCVSKLMMGNCVFDEPRARITPWNKCHASKKIDSWRAA